MKNQIIGGKMKKTVAVLIAVCFTAAEILLWPVITMRSPLGGAIAQAQEYGPPDQYPDRDYPPPDRDYGPPPDQAYSSRDPGYPQRGPEYPPPPLLSPDQLDNLLAPVALYPDRLLAHILVAATFADQIEDAARWMHAYNDPNGIDSQPWDVSVKAIAHYPSVLYMMTDRIDWTVALGQAYVGQPDDVFAAVQHLRAMAYSAGTLRTMPPYEEVVYEPGYITIAPYEPDYLYVPVYDPAVVFFAPAFFVYPAAVITFGPPFLIGAFLVFNFDFRARRIINVNNISINIRINVNIVRRSVNISNLNRFTSVHRNVRFDNLARGNWNERGNPNAGNRSFSRGSGNPRTDSFRGRSSFDQRTARAWQDRSAQLRGRSQSTPSSPRDFHQPSRGSFGGNRSFDPRSYEHGPSSRTWQDRSAELRGRSQLGPSSPRDFHQPPRGSFGGNRSFDPRSYGDRGSFGRSREQHFAPSQHERFQGAQAPRQERPTGSKHPEKGFRG